MLQIDPKEIIVNDIKEGKRFDTQDSTMLCARTGSEGIGETKLGFNFMSLWRQNLGGELFFVAGSADIQGNIHYRILTVDEYSSEMRVSYSTYAGVDSVGEFVLLCTPEAYINKRADWYESILGKDSHKLPA